MGAGNPCRLYCLDPFEGMVKGLDPNATFIVKETLFKGQRCRVRWTPRQGRRSDVSRVAVFFYLVPVLTVVMGFICLGEVPTAISLLGGVLVLGGVIIANARGPLRTN